MFQIKKGQPALLLAPMEGMVDAPMRALFSEIGGFDFCVAEFLRISHNVPPRKTFIKHVPELTHGGCAPSGLPVQVQLLGGDPDKLAASACVAIEAGARAIDLNFGCPARTVNRRDGGATLLRYPQRIEAIVRAVSRALPRHIPVSAKLRLGWDDPHQIDANADAACQGGASWITIHGRTKMQGYRPPADWLSIGRIRARLPIAVVANGEIWRVEDLLRCQQQTGCEHFMLGRGAMADPHLPRKAAAALGLKPEPRVPLKPAWHAWMLRLTQLEALYPHRQTHVPGRLKQWLKQAHSQTPSAAYLRIRTLNDTEAILRCLQACSHAAANETSCAERLSC